MLVVLHEIVCLVCFKKLTCLACFIKWHVGVFQKTGVLGVLQKFDVLNDMTCLTCLKLIKCFLDVFDQGALGNCVDSVELELSKLY